MPAMSIGRADVTAFGQRQRFKRAQLQSRPRWRGSSSTGMNPATRPKRALLDRTSEPDPVAERVGDDELDQAVVLLLRFGHASDVAFAQLLPVRDGAPRTCTKHVPGTTESDGLSGWEKCSSTGPSWTSKYPS